MISIIIPVYNQADKIYKCLESILGQDYRNYEIIIVNDGSSDNIADIVNEFKNKFIQSNINFIFLNQKNGGAPNARNNGFKKSNGEYILFCDADIVFQKNALNTMLNSLRNNKNTAYVYSNFYWGKKLFKLFPFNAKKLKEMPYIHTTSLIKKEDLPLDPWDENIKKLQDWDLWLTMLENDKSGLWIDKTLFKVYTGGTMSDWLPSFVYKLCPFLPKVKKYNKAIKIIKNKHKLK